MLAAGATLGICDADGISASGPSGAVRVAGTRSFSPDALYVYNGTVAQAGGSGLPATVRSLTLANAAGLSLGAALTAGTSVVLSEGELRTGAHAVTLGPGGTLSETATGYLTGTIQTTRDVSSPGSSQTFGGLGLTLTPAPGSAALPGATLVRRVTGTALSGAAGHPSIRRYFDIQPTTNANLDVTLTLSYRDAELNGLPEASLALYKSSTGPGGPWVRQPTTLDATANLATRPGVTDFSTWTLGSLTTPLPVVLSSFTATATTPPATVHLRWATANETHSAYFEVERSADGRTFTPIGRVAAAGQAATPRTYSFLDANAPAGRLYYRLRQVDADGSASYSPVRNVAVAAAGPLRLYPNPSAGTATLAGAAPGQPVQLLDALGRLLRTTPADASGTARLSGLAPGLYLVRVGPATQRLLVQ